MADINTFPCKGLEIEVSAGNEKEQAYIKFTENGVVKEFRIDGNKSSKSNQEVIVFYNKFIKDSAGVVYNQDILQSFDATKQESSDYFYNTPAEKIGLKTDQMSINGLLYELFKALCYDPQTGSFYPPITAEIEVIDETVSIHEPEESEEPILPNIPESPNQGQHLPMLKPDQNGKIKVNPIDLIGNPTFSIPALELSNETGEFADLSAGIHKIIITSDAAEMPCILVAYVGLVNAE